MKIPSLLNTTLIVLTLTTSRADFAPYQAADLVLGQGNTPGSFTTSASGTDEFGLNSPRDIAIDPISGKVFVADSGNHRVLRFPSSAALTNGVPAEVVLGQTGFNIPAPIAATEAGRMSFPTGVFVDLQGRLWVADSGNHRILRFDNAKDKTNGTNAEGVLGQAGNFNNSNPGAGTSRLNQPKDIVMETSSNPGLWVSDSGNNRVICFKSPQVNTDAADVVLGQVSFLDTGFGSANNKMHGPAGLAISGDNTLWVADQGNNHRVLRFDYVGGKQSGDPANGLLGQKDFDISGAGAAGPDHFNIPDGVAVDASGTLYVGEFANNRVLIFKNAATRENGAPADGVLGQPDFTTTSGVVTSQSTRAVRGVTVDAEGRLYVAQSIGAHRVTRFSPLLPTVATVVNGTPIITVKKSIVTSKNPYTLKGKAFSALGIMKVQYKLGGAFKTAKGTVSWKAKLKLKVGINKVKIRATATNGQIANKSAKIKRL